MAIPFHQLRRLPDPHRAQCRIKRVAGMHRSRRTWARKRSVALRGSRHWQIAADRRTATVRRNPRLPIAQLVSAFQPIVPARMLPCLTCWVRFWHSSHLHRLQLLWDPLHARSFPCFLSRFNTCPNWQASLLCLLWTLNRSNADSSRRWQRSSCEPQSPDRCCW